MRLKDIPYSQKTSINWLAGSVEITGLNDRSTDWSSMYSSFHWANFSGATHEFQRILRPGGLFTAVWNSQLIELNSLLAEIKLYLYSLHPDIRRVSSLRSGVAKTLTEQLWTSPYFNDVEYIERPHVIEMTTQRYLGVWRSDKDMHVQISSEKFSKFLEFIENRTTGLEDINATYLTHSWSARRKK